MIEFKKNKSDIIRDYIYNNIMTRTYQDRVPSLQDLAGHFEVNIKTAAKAIKRLEDEGWLIPKGAKGTFINQRKLFKPSVAYVGVKQEVSAHVGALFATAISKSGLDYSSYSSFATDQYKTPSQIMPQLQTNTVGLLLDGTLYNRIKCFLSNVNIPAVFLFAAFDDGMPCVYQDAESGIKQAMDHLRALGHEKIAYLGPRTAEYSWHIDGIKERAFKNYIKQNKLPHKRSWLPETFYKADEGYDAAKKVLSKANYPTAFVCVNDEIALGAINACEELGLSVPHDISIIGFDDRKPATLRNPKLTTVRVDYDYIIEQGITMLNDIITNEPLATSRMKIPVLLNVRQSTGPVKRKG